MFAEHLPAFCVSYTYTYTYWLRSGGFSRLESKRLHCYYYILVCFCRGFRFGFYLQSKSFYVVDSIWLRSWCGYVAFVVIERWWSHIRRPLLFMEYMRYQCLSLGSSQPKMVHVVPSVCKIMVFTVWHLREWYS